MKRLTIAALLLVAGACGSLDTGLPGTTHIDGPGLTTTTIPRAGQLDLLTAAKLLWDANRPDAYEMTYELACECDQGPWFVRVEGSVTVVARRVGLGPDPGVPYHSVDEIFDSIRATIDAGDFPVDVEYDAEYGYPRSYIFNEPELPVDGGFVLTVREFVAEPPPGDPQQREAFVAALSRWEDNGSPNYDYTFTRGCFCPEEHRGPYSVTVRSDEVVSASFRGIDLFDIQSLEIGRYDEIVKTVYGLFAEIERALREADSFTVAYHPELGYPTDVYIDWISNAADDEVSYTIAGLRDPSDYPETCSTGIWDIELTVQPGLPEPVANTRKALFAAAMTCDFAGLVDLAEAGGRPFETTFGGSGPEIFWEGEGRGEPILRTLVEHLNLPYAESVDGAGATYYAWPSAFVNLTSPYGDGISSDDYEALLELYPVEELEYMFEQIGGFTGWRHIIAPDGEWLYFIAGD